MKNLKIFQKKGKRNSPRFWIRPGQTSSCWDNFYTSQKVSEEWKENFRMSQESFEKLWTGLKPYIQKNKTFCFYFRKFSPRVYLTKQHNYFANRKSYRTTLFIED